MNSLGERERRFLVLSDLRHTVQREKERERERENRILSVALLMFQRANARASLNRRRDGYGSGRVTKICSYLFTTVDLRERRPILFLLSAPRAARSLAIS